MRRLVQDTTARLQEFVAQRETLLLLVQCRDEDTAYVSKTIDAIDEASQDVFFGFGDVFAEPKSYADAIVKNFQLKAELLAKKLAEAEEPPWPPLFPVITDASAPPVKRLQALFGYARARIPDIEASHLVVILCPLHVGAPHAWRAFLRQLIEHDLFTPWCHHMRIIAREPETISFDGISEEWRTNLDVSKWSRTSVFPVDFSLEALHRATKEEIADPSIPLADRMQSLFVDANVDYAHMRYEPAIEKYKLLRVFYETLQNGAMLAATLNGLGEVYARARVLGEAVAHFQLAVDVATEAKCHPVLLNVSINLGNLYFGLQDWTHACDYFLAAETLATALLNANVKLACLENIGVCRRQLNDYPGAQAAWTNGATLARNLEEKDALRRQLDRLRGLYSEAGMRTEMAAIDREIGALA